VLEAVQRRATGAAIARVQRGDGSIPWYPGGPVDPWDHVEAAMGLDLAGRHGAAERAYHWLRLTQRRDGSWPSRRVRGKVTDATGDANFAAYVAAGVWHHVLATGDETMAGALWPTVERAVGHGIGLQAPGGEIWWARDPLGTAFPVALLTASSAILLSLRCAGALADHLGRPRPDWELAATRLASALRDEGAFAPAGRHAMDWYWPVLAGTLDPQRARAHLREGWQRYVVEGLGVRCVEDRPWVTAAETCELVMALTLCGEDDRARGLFADIQHLRDGDGAYWTGYVWPDRARWPVERTTWTAGAVLMAADALSAGSPTRLLLQTRLDMLAETAQYAQ
jgi:hypothetical protein